MDFIYTRLVYTKSGGNSLSNGPQLPPPPPLAGNELCKFAKKGARCIGGEGAGYIMEMSDILLRWLTTWTTGAHGDDDMKIEDSTPDSVVLVAQYFLLREPVKNYLADFFRQGGGRGEVVPPISAKGFGQDDFPLRGGTP